jgi:hypothetical protein
LHACGYPLDEAHAHEFLRISIYDLTRLGTVIPPLPFEPPPLERVLARAGVVWYDHPLTPEFLRTLPDHPLPPAPVAQRPDSLPEASALAGTLNPHIPLPSDRPRRSRIRHPNPSTLPPAVRVPYGAIPRDRNRYLWNLRALPVLIPHEYPLSVMPQLQAAVSAARYKYRMQLSLRSYKERDVVVLVRLK